MPFAPTVTHDSITIPGVSFTVHRLGLGRRTDIDFTTLQFRQRLREIEADYPSPSDREKELTQQLEIAKKKSLAVPADQFKAVIAADVKPLAVELAAAIPLEAKKQRAVLDEEYAQVDARMRAAWIRAGLIAIVHRKDDEPVEDGLDGMTADQLLDYGPTALAQEIYAALAGDGRLRGRESPNSVSPITSGGVVGGENQSTTVRLAEVPPEVGTLIETASSISRGT